MPREEALIAPRGGGYRPSVRWNLARESFRRAFFGLRSFDFAVFGWRCRHEVVEQVTRDVGDLVDRVPKRFFIGLGWFGRSTDLADVLNRGGPDFIVVGGRLEIVKGSDIAAHISHDTPIPTFAREVLAALWGGGWRPPTPRRGAVSASSQGSKYLLAGR